MGGCRQGNDQEPGQSVDALMTTTPEVLLITNSGLIPPPPRVDYPTVRFRTEVTLPRKRTRTRHCGRSQNIECCTKGATDASSQTCELQVGHRKTMVVSDTVTSLVGCVIATHYTLALRSIVLTVVIPEKPFQLCIEIKKYSKDTPMSDLGKWRPRQATETRKKRQQEERDNLADKHNASRYARLHWSKGFGRDRSCMCRLIGCRLLCSTLPQQIRHNVDMFTFHDYRNMGGMCVLYYQCEQVRNTPYWKLLNQDLMTVTVIIRRLRMLQRPFVTFVGYQVRILL